MSKNNRLVLGTVQLGIKYGINNTSGKPNDQQAMEILKTAKAEGIRALDTADGYGSGQNLIAQFGADQFSIYSKFILQGKSFKQCLEQTLGELKTRSITGYSFHRFSELPHFSFYEEVEEAKKQKKIKHFGVSIYSNEDFLSAIENDHIDFIQIPFNLFDNYLARGKYLELAKKKNKVIQIRSIFLQGLFFKTNVISRPKLAPLEHALKQIREIANEYNITVHELCMRYAHSFSTVDQILFGTETLEQLKFNLNCDKSALPNEVLEKIHQVKISDLQLLNPGNWN
jgi:aryl-alcohol dehydrogenase-like predicted oxidoreductase